MTQVLASGVDGEEAVVGAVRDDLVVHRNGTLLAAVTLLAGAVAAAWAWRGLQGSVFGWLVVAVLAGVALTHLRAWVDARKPLLVADPRGVRIRLGRSWTGFDWEELDSVVVRPRRHLLADGTVLVLPRTGDAYEVRVGVTSASSREDIGPALSALAAGRTTVVAPDAPARRPGDNQVRPAPPAVVVGPADETEPQAASESLQHGQERSYAEPVEVDAATPNNTAPTPTVEPAHPAVAAAAFVPPGPRRAVRADVRRPGPLSVGALALSQDARRGGGELPEVTELRGTQGRVGLVIEHVASPNPADITPYAVPTTSAPIGSDAVVATEPVIGPQLAQARTRLRVSVDQLADRTRIRPHVIEAMEVDDFEPCGGDFYARGHLRRLATVLGLDPDPLLDDYDARYGHGPIAASAVFSAELASGPGAALRGTRGGPNWRALLGVVVALLVLWGVARFVTGGEPSAVPTQPDAVASSAPAPDPDRFAGIGAVPRTVSVTTTADTVVRLLDAEGKTIWIGPLQAGESRRWSITGAVTIRARDADAVTAQLGTQDPVAVGREDVPDEVTLGIG